MSADMMVIMMKITTPMIANAHKPVKETMALPNIFFPNFMPYP